MPSIAIVGSGPAGCYTAQYLAKKLPSAQVVVFDRLPVPYGLLRYGVAPDHVGTKAVTAQFDRLFERDGVHFAGNVEIGATVSLGAVRDAFDAVVIATGLYGDIPLAVDGATLPEVIGAGRFTRSVNLHPDETEPLPFLGEHVVVVGMGNVSIDVVRLLARPASDLVEYDCAHEMLSSVGSRVRIIDVAGRSPVGSAKCDPVMLKELSRIPGVAFEVHDHVPGGGADGAQGEGFTARLDAVRDLAAVHPADARIVVRLHFGAVPTSIDGDEHVQSVRIALANGQCRRLSASAVITAIGFERRPHDLHARGDTSGVFLAGWARRGPRGTIPESRVEARETGQAVIEWLAAHPALAKPGLAGLATSIVTEAVEISESTRAWPMPTRPRERTTA